MYKLALSD